MAHVYKVKRSALAPMVAHYERTPELERGYERGNIDSSRTHLNYNLAPHDVLAAVEEAVAMHERNSGRKIRSDANLVYDWVVTQPKDVQEGDSRRFFEAVRDFAVDTYGFRVLGVYVHMDETTPHAHIPVLPLRGGRLNGKQVINRNHMRQFHPRLAKAVEEKLGYPVSIELDESARGEKELSRLDQKDYRAAKKRLAELADEVSREEDRLEIAKQETVKAKSDCVRAKLDASMAKSDLKTVQEAVRASEIQRDEIDEEIRRCIAASRQRAAEAARAREEAAEAEATLNATRDEIEEELRRKECLQRETSEIEREIERVEGECAAVGRGGGASGRAAELEPIVGLVREFERKGRPGRGEVLRGIADRCDGLREEVLRRVGGLREKVQSIARPVMERVEYLLTGFKSWDDRTVAGLISQVRPAVESEIRARQEEKARAAESPLQAQMRASRSARSASSGSISSPSRGGWQR